MSLTSGEVVQENAEVILWNLGPFKGLLGQESSHVVFMWTLLQCIS